MQLLSKTLKPLEWNQMYYQSIWSKISFIALYSFFLRLWYNLFWISFRATDIFLWKVWMYKLVMLCSHGHFQFEFHLTTQIYLFNWPQKLSRETCFQKKSKSSFQPIFKSLNITVSEFWPVLTLTSCPRGKLDQVSEGKLGVQMFVNLSIFKG